MLLLRFLGMQTHCGHCFDCLGCHVCLVSCVCDARLTAQPFLTETFDMGRVGCLGLHFWLVRIALQHSIVFPGMVPSQRHAGTVTFVYG